MFVNFTPTCAYPTTYIEVVDSCAYDPSTNTFITYKTWTDSQYNLIVKLHSEDGGIMKGKGLHFMLLEKPNTDMNGNNIKGEELFNETDYNCYIESDNEVSIAKWFKNQLPNLPPGYYDIKIKFSGDYNGKWSEKMVTLNFRG